MAEKIHPLVEKLKKLRKGYIEEFPKKRKELEIELNKVKGKIEPFQFASLKLLVHRIAGNAGSFGFPETGKLCKEFDEHIQQLIDKNEDKFKVDEFADKSKRFLRDLDQTFQKELG